MMMHSVGMKSASANIIDRLPLLIETLGATATALNEAQPVMWLHMHTLCTCSV